MRKRLVWEIRPLSDEPLLFPSNPKGTTYERNTCPSSPQTPYPRCQPLHGRSLPYSIKKGFRKAMAKKEPILVVTIADNIVKKATLFTNVKLAEEAFTIAAMDLGARKEDMDDHLDNGYYENIESVCITWPDLNPKSCKSFVSNKPSK